MFEATSTGKNICFGKKGERIKIADNHTLNALMNGWVEPTTLKYLISKFHKGQAIKEKKVAIMPEKKVFILNELKLQTRSLERIEKDGKNH